MQLIVKIPLPNDYKYFTCAPVQLPPQETSQS